VECNAESSPLRHDLEALKAKIEPAPMLSRHSSIFLSVLYSSPRVALVNLCVVCDDSTWTGTCLRSGGGFGAASSAAGCSARAL